MLYSRHHKGFKETPKQQELDLQEVDSGRKSKRGAKTTDTPRTGKTKRPNKKELSNASESGGILPTSQADAPTEESSG